MCLLSGILFTGPYNAGVECEDMRQPRIGHINFINCLPLTYGFSSGGFAKGLNVNEGVPSTLNQKAIEGQLDVTPVSSIIYAQHPDKFLLMPNLSISAEGALQSIYCCWAVWPGRQKNAEQAARCFLMLTGILI